MTPEGPGQPMIRYRVVDLNQDGSLVAVLDGDGVLHVARIDPAHVLARDDDLLGREAKLGSHLLLDQFTRATMPVHFEAIGCTQGQALALLHPASGPAAAH